MAREPLEPLRQTSSPRGSHPLILPELRKPVHSGIPITGTAGCCARAASGHAAARPSTVMKSRRFTASVSRASNRKDSTPPHRGRLLRRGSSTPANVSCGVKSRHCSDVRCKDRFSTESGSQSAILLCRESAMSRHMQCSKTQLPPAPPALLAVVCRISPRLMIALRFLRIVEYHFCELGLADV